jgi:AcrR family transcriptional regulator
MKPRGYRSDLRAEQARATRARILEAVLRLGVLDHLALPTHAAVARAAGVAERTVYRHFPTAEHLREAFAKWRREHLRPEEGDDLRLDELPDLYEKLPERMRATGLLDAYRPRVVPPALFENRELRLRGIERALSKSIPDATPTQRRQLALLLYVLTSFDALIRGQEHYGFEPEQVVPVMSWALRIIVERLLRGDDPWVPEGRPRRKRRRA